MVQLTKDVLMTPFEVRKQLNNHIVKVSENELVSAFCGVMILEKRDKKAVEKYEKNITLQKTETHLFRYLPLTLNNHLPHPLPPPRTAERRCI